MMYKNERFFPFSFPKCFYNLPQSKRQKRKRQEQKTKGKEMNMASWSIDRRITRAALLNVVAFISETPKDRLLTTPGFITWAFPFSLTFPKSQWRAQGLWKHRQWGKNIPVPFHVGDIVVLLTYSPPPGHSDCLGPGFQNAQCFTDGQQRFILHCNTQSPRQTHSGAMP